MTSGSQVPPGAHALQWEAHGNQYSLVTAAGNSSMNSLALGRAEAAVQSAGQQEGMMEATEQRLQAIFQGVFELQGNGNATTCERSSTTAWDSMGHVMLMVAIEQEFGISIEAADSLGITSYDLARQYLAALGI